jgi:hypothetical protein
MPPKHVSPLLGYNNNVRHKGKVFHIQTEDSGVKYGHIITHLFMDGGRILKSVKTSYAEYVDNDRMGEIVREMMKQQHKAMFIALRDGKFDPIIDGAESPSTQSFPAAQPAAAPASGPVSGPLPETESPSSSTMAAAAHARGQLTPSPAPPVSSRAGKAASPAPPLATARSSDVSVDIDAVERAAAAASPAAPQLRTSDDLPPPPANLLRERAANSGKYRVTSPPAANTAVRPATQNAAAGPAARGSSSSVPAAGRGSVPPGERRYAPTRPASIFGQARPQQGKSIFGEDLISDKSLDEVILSYLAEDLDGEKK